MLRSRLLRDLHELRAEPLPGIAAEPVPACGGAGEDLYAWRVNFQGQGPLLGVVLHLHLYFPDDWPFRRPRGILCSMLPHYCEGVCSDWDVCGSLEQNWSPGISVSMLLLQLRSFLFDDVVLDETTPRSVLFERCYSAPRLPQDLHASIDAAMRQAQGLLCACGHSGWDPQPAMAGPPLPRGLLLDAALSSSLALLPPTGDALQGVQAGWASGRVSEEVVGFDAHLTWTSQWGVATPQVRVGWVAGPRSRVLGCDACSVCYDSRGTLWHDRVFIERFGPPLVTGDVLTCRRGRAQESLEEVLTFLVNGKEVGHPVVVPETMLFVQKFPAASVRFAQVRFFPAAASSRGPPPPPPPSPPLKGVDWNGRLPNHLVLEVCRLLSLDDLRRLRGAEGMERWAELVQQFALQERLATRCYISKEPHDGERGAVIGVLAHPLVSVEASALVGMTCDVTPLSSEFIGRVAETPSGHGQYFLPLPINAEHSQRAWPLLQVLATQLRRPVQEVIAAALRTALALREPSSKRAHGVVVTRLHHWLLRIGDPDGRVRKRVDAFCFAADPTRERGKHFVPQLTLIAIDAALVCRYPASVWLAPFVEELLVRHVEPRDTRHNPLEEGAVHFLLRTFAAAKDSWLVPALRSLCVVQALAAGAAGVREYDCRYGVAPEGLLRAVAGAQDAANGVETWEEALALLGFESLANDDMRRLLTEPRSGRLLRRAASGPPCAARPRAVAFDLVRPGMRVQASASKRPRPIGSRVFD